MKTNGSLKGLDSVPHSGLILKVESYGSYLWQILKLDQNFLSDKEQCVVLKCWKI